MKTYILPLIFSRIRHVDLAHKFSYFAFLSLLFFGGCSNNEKVCDRVISDINQIDTLKALIINSCNLEIDFYTKPNSFNEKILSKYWIPPIEDLDTDWRDIANSIYSLKKNKLRYAKVYDDKFDSTHFAKNIILQFNEYCYIDSLQIKAKVTTTEKWLVPVIDINNNFVLKQEIIGPYRVIYELICIEDKWYVLDSDTPRSNSAWNRKLIFKVVIITIFSFFFTILYLLQFQKKWQPKKTTLLKLKIQKHWFQLRNRLKKL